MPERLAITKGFLNNQNIDEVVGLNISYSNSDVAQANFPSPYALYTPQGIAFDKFGNLWAADAGRHAVVMYPPQNQYNGAPATFIIGQPNLNTNTANPDTPTAQNNFDYPFFIAFDNNNNLWVSDTTNMRILGFKYPFGSGGVLNASWVILQPNFTSSSTGTTSSLASTTANSFCFDNENNLWVVDRGNNRVLGFAANNIYSTGGAQASWVIGQPSFTTNTAETLSAKSLYNPSSVSIDKNGNLWVCDNDGGSGGNYRILGYTNPKSINPAANYVIGQPNFTTITSQVTQNGLVYPSQIIFDNNNNLWVYDFYRILGFAANSLYGNNQPNASWLMFQPNYTSSATATLSQGETVLYDNAGFFYVVPTPDENIVAALPNPYQINYGSPLFLAFDSDNNIWISDTSNYRIMQYLNPTQNTYPYNCSTVLGQSAFYIKGVSGSTQYNLYFANDIAFDNNNNLWVADMSGMVKGFQYPNYNQQVIQNWAIGGSFTTSGGLVQNGMSPDNHCVSFDNFGNMFATDNTNNRILGFTASSLYGNNSPNAFVVIGQPNFTTATANTTQNGLNIASSVTNAYFGKTAFDADNNMYVADSNNNRILVFPYGSGFTIGMNATIVIGQTSFTTNTSGSTASTLAFPTGIAFDKFGNIWVCDSDNNRIQKFIPPFTTGMSASVSITGFGGSTAYRVFGIVFDKQGNLITTDSGNNRILIFTPSSITSSTTVSSASVILGQPNSSTVTSGTSIDKLSNPLSLAINPVSGNLWCADLSNNRYVGWEYTHKATLSNKYNSKYIFYNE